MSGHTHEEVNQHVKKYLFVFFSLIAGTIITVGASYIHFSNFKLTVALALFIALIKAFLVAAYFMHLISEKKMIYSILASTVFFFGGLMYLTIWSMEPASYPVGTVHIK